MGHVARVLDEKCGHIQSEKLRERDLSEGMSVGDWVILKMSEWG